jgi:hypothetical protein
MTNTDDTGETLAQELNDVLPHDVTIEDARGLVARFSAGTQQTNHCGRRASSKHWRA